jgi:hypothetical protein
MEVHRIAPLPLAHASRTAAYIDLELRKNDVFVVWVEVVRTASVSAAV